VTESAMGGRAAPTSFAEEVGAKTRLPATASATGALTARRP
jgi:hypothetical protein